jgi:hypothetical protein
MDAEIPAAVQAARRALSANLSITQRTSDGQESASHPGIGPEMSHTTLTVPGINEPPRLHDVTTRVAKETGHHRDPAAFAAEASRAATGRNAAILSAHTVGEIIS